MNHTHRDHDPIVVTGIGLLTPAGRGTGATWEGVLAGKTTATLHDGLVAAGTSVTLACQAPPFDPDSELGRGAARRQDRYTHLALLAAHEALTHARLTDAATHDSAWPLAEVDADRVGVLLGSGIGGAQSWDQEYAGYVENGPDRVSPMFIPRMLSNSAGGAIAIRTGARGPNLTVNTACAAGATALHLARDLLRSDGADVVVAGGVEAGITPLAVAAFARMGALSSNDDPSTASRPFDVDRDGFVMGEGAGVLVLESLSHARARGAEPLAVLAGAGASADAHHATAPPEDGGGAVLAMQRALTDAGLSPADVGHLNAHGTSTPLNDATEARAIRTVFGHHTDGLAVTSTKGVTGHLLGAAGAVEAAVSVLTLRDQLLPPTAGLHAKDPEIDLDVVHGEPRSARLEAVQSNSFGFGGQNASLVFTRV